MHAWYAGSVHAWYAGSAYAWYAGSVHAWYAGSVLHAWYAGSVLHAWYAGSAYAWYAGSLLTLSCTFHHSCVQVTNSYKPGVVESAGTETEAALAATGVRVSALPTELSRGSFMHCHV